MGFLDILKELVDNIHGGVAGTIMAKDGIAIQNYVKEQPNWDMESLGVEYARILAETKNTSSMLKLGELEEVVISTIASTIIMRLINQDYFMGLVLDSRRNIGKAKYLLKRAVASARKEL
ncbi:MAG: hypothetical protein A2X87_02370 [Deltaproteobacteria bacterium GWC2_42_51]|nr:MAG: hypothetical protein A2067_04755 [Deltaproteobacteria bacterium GWB2_42_7]OGP33518.1 MAG: hypothetical protein A2X87_02370 [Deltaproteobacteria bacterium GWC2_42_51]OGP38670.1 MAG: hypothetical protein A2090_03750 [Deltaproteobacteria bacterium GWD2_42_10]OGQ25555.1 MAG: hypothetical protein A3D29_04455 [Deltaproteobacteria bacterium RIFCSPHIGHO2_02_FULL_42_44]OGQ37326.1 MAG: hypothetical protein A3H47_08205 [Deltaproteobacteria bacterium RIFCSPLOWO2_02_FULL_42_39]OGQ68836.1 MAG: hypot